MKLILIIDDDERIRASFGRALRNQGYRVIESDSGLAGLELARAQMPDLILSDIHMPGGDGESLLQQIRADPELSTKQVVLMTGRPDLVSPRRGMEQGADDFLVKPVSRDALLSCMQARLKRADVHWRVEDRVLSRVNSFLPAILPHEFFTPLAGIIGLTEILNADSGSLSADELREFSQDIHQSALRLHRTLRNYLLILDQRVSPGGGSNTSPAIRAEDLPNLIKRACAAVVDRFGRDADLNFKVAPLSLKVSSNDLAIIVEELVDNAFKFSRKGTPVIVEFKAEGVLVVSDCGRGMTEKEISEIGVFQQFERKTHEQQGLGLGLMLVKKLAELNRAELVIRARADLGIEACVTFQVSPVAI
jgi:signal transduction histidine kinase